MPAMMNKVSEEENKNIIFSIMNTHPHTVSMLKNFVYVAQQIKEPNKVFIKRDP